MRSVSVLLVALSLLLPASSLKGQATGTVTGVVTNATSGEAIPGARISIPGRGLGTQADNVGRYVLVDVPVGLQVVRAESIGFSAQERQVEVTRAGSVVLDFALRSEAISLEGVVVTGPAGQSRRREVGTSIAQITSAQVENAPIMDAADILMGRAAGVTVQMNSGQVGVGSSIRLRGNNSLLMGNNPLIVVDGVAIRSMGTQFMDEPGQSAAPLTDINPDDIERIEVLKGPAASTIYGAAAGSGVIGIFTKRGSSGPAAWSMAVDYGVNNMGHLGPPEIGNGLWMNDCSEFGREVCPNGDWLDNGFVQKYHLSVRGGSEVSSYFLSGSWWDERGVIDQAGFQGEDEGQRSWSLRGNFGFNPRDDLTIQFNNAFIHKDVDWFPDGNNAEGVLLNVMRGDAGVTPNNDDGLVFGMKLKTLTDHFTTGVNAVYAPGGGFSHYLAAGLDWVQDDYQEEHPYDYWRVPLGSRQVHRVLTQIKSVDYGGSWRRTAGTLTSRLNWGAVLYAFSTSGLNGFGDDFAGPGDKELDSAARTSAYETRQDYTNGGFYLQEMMGWKDQLFLTVGLRWDGHSAFGKDVGLAAYPQAALAYMVSDHDFFPESWGTLKLRAAFGESGKAPGLFDAARTWAPTSGDEGRAAVTPDNLGNPDLGPERTREIEVGFEGSTLGGRLTFDFTRYDQKTRDAFIRVQQRPSAGFVGTQVENVGGFKNRGHEVSLSLNALNREKLRWDVGGHFSTNRSEILGMGNLDRISLGYRNEARVGHALPEYCDRVVQNGDAVGEAPIMGESECLGPVYPTHTYGISSSFTFWRRLTVDLLGEGQGGHVLAAAELFQNTRRFVNPLCYEVQERIRAGNTADLKTYDWALCDRTYMTWGMWVQKADFFKLRSASISYRIPERWLPGRIRGATVRLQGRNLFRITDFQGLDPEVSENGANALYRQGYYHLPAPRTFLLSLKVDV